MMRGLEHLIADLADAIPASSGDTHVRLVVDEVSIGVPMEARAAPDGGIEATLPRGQLGTGFDVPHGRLYIQLAVRDEP